MTPRGKARAERLGRIGALAGARERRDTLREAALAYADAETDAEYRRADDRLLKAAVRLSNSQGARS